MARRVAARGARCAGGAHADDGDGMRVSEAWLGAAAEHDNVARSVERELLEVVELTRLAVPADQPHAWEPFRPVRAAAERGGPHGEWHGARRCYCYWSDGLAGLVCVLDD